MAQLAISAAGAAVGFYIAGPAGAQAGWALGSLVGAVAFPEKTQGPRLQDTQIQISSYGAPIPIVYGGVRLAGVVVWSTDLQESGSESSGKGGPTVTTFSYTVNCAIAICEGPIGGIRRIWADTKLVYDAREDSEAIAQAASAAFAEHMVVYLGTEDQSPDPTIEAEEGVGNVEAYRGTAYIVFNDLPLGDYGNRIPNFTFETTTEPIDVLDVETLAPHGIPSWRFNPITGVPEATPWDPSSEEAGPMEVVVANEGAGGGIYLGFYTGTNELPSFFSGGATLDDDPEFVYGLFCTTVPEILETGAADGYAGCGDCLGAGLGAFDSRVVLTRSSWDSFGRSVSMQSYEGSSFTNFCFVTYPGDYPPGGFPAAYSEVLKVVRYKRLPRCDDKVCGVGDPCTNANGYAELPSNPDFCLSCDGDVVPQGDFIEQGGTYKQLAIDEFTSHLGVAFYRTGVAQGPVIESADPRYTDAAFWEAAAAAAGVTGTYDAAGTGGDDTFPRLVTTVCRSVYTAQVAEAGSMLLSEIVTDICLRAGYAESDIDVSQLVDEVQGYVVPRQMTARSAIEPLRQAYFFDAVENGDEIVFVKRGAASIAAIESDDLGASESGESVALVVPKRSQETELPAEVAVAYMVREADYQTGTQQARRVTTGSQQVVTVELPIVMTDQKAAEVADVLMVDAWQGRVERKFSTTRKWTKYLPTNVLTVDDGEFQYRGRITNKVENGPVIEWTLRDETVATFSPNVTPSVTSGGGGEIRFYGPISIELLDVPALRDDDDDAGFYAAAGGYTSSFRGGVLYKSNDDLTFSALENLNVRATLGHATVALGNFYGGNVFDEISSVTVLLHSGSLESVTRSQVLHGGNAALIGDEIIQFRTATLTGTNTYRLSGLLRGRRGTEWAMSGHLSSDRFVLLNEATIYRIAQSLPQIGLAYYRGVAYGTSVADAISEEFTNTAAALKPLSPVHLAATPDGSDYVLTWIRRTRIGGAWADGIDAPLSEASESYRVRLYDATSTLLDEQTVSSPTATVGAGYSVEVVQMSASVGAGFPATIVL